MTFTNHIRFSVAILFLTLSIHSSTGQPFVDVSTEYDTYCFGEMVTIYDNFSTGVDGVIAYLYVCDSTTGNKSPLAIDSTGQDSIVFGNDFFERYLALDPGNYRVEFVGFIYDPFTLEIQEYFFPGGGNEMGVTEFSVQECITLTTSSSHEDLPHNPAVIDPLQYRQYIIDLFSYSPDFRNIIINIYDIRGALQYSLNSKSDLNVELNQQTAGIYFMEVLRENQRNVIRVSATR